MSLSKEIEKFLHSEFEPLIGCIKTKRVFSALGIFQNDQMFAIYFEGKIYLRATDKLAEKLEKLGSMRFREVVKKRTPGLALYHYYELPPQISNDKVMLKEVLTISSLQAQEYRDSIEESKTNRIKELINLNAKHERLLAKIGIYTVDDFRRVGAFDAYVMLKKIGIDCSLVLFLLFYAALMNVNIHRLNDDIKRICLTELSEHLYENGFRRFDVERFLAVEHLL